MVEYPGTIALPNTKKGIKLLLNTFPEISSTEDNIQYIIEPKVSGIDVSISLNECVWETSTNKDIDEVISKFYGNTILFIQDMIKDSEHIDKIDLFLKYDPSTHDMCVYDMFINELPVSYITTTHLFYHWKSCCRSNLEMKPFTVLPCYPITTDIETFMCDVLKNKKNIKKYLETTEYIERLPSFNNLPKDIFDN